ncbi:hypothetical protein [Roseateles depolymerans]|uniref:Uncharacterized protein n=1 Tax=Roseateles depolymerans TaxID=76731 RepID=A0A0U3DV01_9BURK|nr:hypothetical protein [Roseateles depolymerans]ALV04565.1 hypothetical protein RD2015_59 [Roseateles depolymerans]REG14097.1 hypothetical protein DES44_4110 [Roseateles depolymerans]
MDKNTMGASLGSAMNAPLPTSLVEPAHRPSNLPAHLSAQVHFAPAPAAKAFKPSHCVSAELLLSTPLTVVVRAKLDFVMDGQVREDEVALVISRNRCEGDHPYWPALLSAAQEHWHRCRGQARRMTACVDGEWQTLLAAQPTAANDLDGGLAAPVQRPAYVQH